MITSESHLSGRVFLH